MQKEQRNYQFDFLRTHHPLFSYFTNLVEQYRKVFLSIIYFLLALLTFLPYCNIIHVYFHIVCFLHVQILLPSHELQSKLRREVEFPYQVCVCVYIYMDACVCVCACVHVH